MTIAVAQYLRMSTEHQQYSLDNQSAMIKQYAERNNFEIVKTYSDPAKSGLTLKERPGLKDLLNDIVAGSHFFQAVLVYDISRWGRFQDSDEAAHYEFLCKSSGVPVHYCAETFTNDGSITSLLLKALKRTMASEYSRELGVKVYAGQKRIYEAGFRGSGGPPGYGLRRLLVTPDGRPKQLLKTYERKSLMTDRVTLVPGPKDEVRTIREIYRLFVTRKETFSSLAREVNRRGMRYLNGKPWTHESVGQVLSNPKYNGSLVYGRTSQKLHRPEERLPRSKWLIVPHAFPAIIDDETFAKAQQIQSTWTLHRSDEDLLDELRQKVQQNGSLTLKMIRSRGGHASTYKYRFGSLRKAYELIGHSIPLYQRIETRRRMQGLRLGLMRELESLFPSSVRVIHRGGKLRAWLEVEGRKVSVRACRRTEYRGWILTGQPDGNDLPTLLALSDPSRTCFVHLYLFASLSWAKDNTRYMTMQRLNQYPKLLLTDLSTFVSAVRKVGSAS